MSEVIKLIKGFALRDWCVPEIVYLLKTLNTDSYDTVPMSNGKTIPFIMARSSYWSMVYSGI